MDSNPAASYTWHHRDNPLHVIAHSPELTFVVSHNTVGEYVCRASVPSSRHGESDHPEVTASAHVYMKGPPRYDYKHNRHFGTVLCVNVSG